MDTTQQTTPVTQAVPEVPTRATGMPVAPPGSGGEGIRKYHDIHVTDEDISNALRGSETHCPIALAIKRVMGVDDVYVGPTGRYGDFGMHLTQREADFVRRFDAGEPVAPYSFVISVPK